MARLNYEKAKSTTLMRERGTLEFKRELEFRKKRELELRNKQAKRAAQSKGRKSKKRQTKVSKAKSIMIGALNAEVIEWNKIRS
jgi:hypothetical protein